MRPIALQGALAVIYLLFSWLFLFAMIFVAAMYLAPYDAVPPAKRPKKGTWRREINDFLERTPTLFYLPYLVVGTSMVLFARALLPATQNRLEVVENFALSNLLTGLGMLLGKIILPFLPLHFSKPPGYGWTIKFFVWDFCLLALLLRQQARSGSVIEGRE